MKFSNATELLANFAGFAALINQARIDELGPNAVPPITPEPYWALEDKKDAEGKVTKIHATYNGKKDYASLGAMLGELAANDVTVKFNGKKNCLEITPMRASADKVNTYGGPAPKAETLKIRQNAARVYMRLLNTKVDRKPNTVALEWNPYTVLPCIVRLLDGMYTETVDATGKTVQTPCTVQNLSTETVDAMYNTEKSSKTETETETETTGNESEKTETETTGNESEKTETETETETVS